ncbi:MAG: F0F1 ATP synthase subunit A [Candidatus Amulumruptor caecigallinarius]|nr:F0F1 ATP synthase subunit A [Candidatus Amulumruptor caecigallinarius]MCM1397594.1 F0F1 ATP synthase subunit A [Candidatus Amulumruptor caecigallinarius]MCM1454098.1 F0F1 ATP synthase subunit A [bacterium]
MNQRHNFRNHTTSLLRTLLAAMVMIGISVSAEAQQSAGADSDKASVQTQAQVEDSVATADASGKTEEAESGSGKIDPKELIFDHLLDGYGWEVPFNHHKRIPLPVIVWGTDGLHCFSSARLDHGHIYVDGNAAFMIAGKESKHKGKVVEIVGGTPVKDAQGNITAITGGKEVKPKLDISITKNVAALFITVILVLWAILGVARWHRRMGMKAPRRMTGFWETLIMFVYDGTIKPTLGKKAPKFAPYLLTVFFFILIMNLMGLVVVFPGGANLTGNIAVTLVLAICTFLVTNIFGTKHYWKEIFWPEVPSWLKVPLPIMPIIEIFGVITKPAALTVRLFANMMGGHMIVLVLTILIFIFASMGPVVLGATTVVSMIFSVFMLLIDVLVSFIQAYVFTMLSTIFISLAQDGGHGHEKAKNPTEAPETPVTSTATPSVTR